MDKPALSICGLCACFYLKNRTIKALDGVDMDLYPGRITALVGGSGSGKSVLSLSVLGLIEKPGKVVKGSIMLEDVDLLALPERKMRRVRGEKIAMIFQEPTNSLNPVIKIKDHLFEVNRLSGERLERRAALGLFQEVLSRVGLRDTNKILESYPFELSGGMCQRIMVAMGLLAHSTVLIADEPTSSLDLTTQAAILKELGRLRDEGISILLITHDLGVVAQMADDVYVIKDGRILEQGTVFEVFEAPKHDYTKLLLEKTDGTN
ncbi:MAG: ABC transporter ATP-binding protein [Spirochaetaceae bacterium]|jgi:ABC-type dipeptide/oligopeptide/nickel transport system ATPase component|nr:ABC transporter ATP-binding protein [Spirochaetaceae bacterium]